MKPDSSLKREPETIQQREKPLTDLFDLEEAKLQEEIKKRGAKIIAISTEKNRIFDECIEIADNAIYSAISAIIPAQLLAYELALAKGMNPDRPKGLEEIVK